MPALHSAIEQRLHRIRGAIDPALREPTILLTGVIVFARYFRGQLSGVNQCDLLLEPEKRRPMNALRIPAGFTDAIESIIRHKQRCFVAVRRDGRANAIAMYCL